MPLIISRHAGQDVVVYDQDTLKEVGRVRIGKVSSGGRVDMLFFGKSGFMRVEAAPGRGIQLEDVPPLPTINERPADTHTPRFKASRTVRPVK